jgi:hypothetical protein
MKPIERTNRKISYAATEENRQLYVVLEVITDDERPRADIQALNTGLSFPPISHVRLGEILVVVIMI